MAALIQGQNSSDWGQIMRRLVAWAAAGAVVLSVSAPALAQRYFITVSGGLLLAPSPTPLAELAQFNNQSFFASFVVDTRSAVFRATGPLGGHGDSGSWDGSGSDGFVALFAPAGTVSLVQRASDPGGLFLGNDVGVPANPNGRLDQATLTSGATAGPGGVQRAYDIFNSTGFSGLPADIFLSSLSFGRTQLTQLPALPSLLSDLSRPDFPALLNAPGTPAFLSMRFRRGTATTGAELLALPAQTLSSTGLSFGVVQLPDVPGAVPEPASWAMLIAGFGLIGAVLRRRRAAVAEAC
jgi:hypothetical protein